MMDLTFAALFVLEPLRVSCQVGPLNEVAREKKEVHQEVIAEAHRSTPLL